MVLTLAIDKLQSGLYRAAALSGSVEVTEPAVYSSIAEAIREEALAVPVGFAHFSDVTYGGASSGTIPLQALSTRAAQVADQLVSVVAEMHRIAEA
jgi:hypothetical protein